MVTPPACRVCGTRLEVAAGAPVPTADTRGPFRWVCRNHAGCTQCDVVVTRSDFEVG